MTNPKTSLKLSLFSGFHDLDLDARFQLAFETAWANSSSGLETTLEISNHPIWEPGCRSDHPQAADQFRIFLGFSAGVVRAAIAAQIAKLRGEKVIGLIAIDGWGVPLVDPTLPTYRWSHDLFTHTTSTVLGGQSLFFADPPVLHLKMWSDPDRVQGWYRSFQQSDHWTGSMTAIEAQVLTIQSLISAALNKLD